MLCGPYRHRPPASRAVTTQGCACRWPCASRGRDPMLWAAAAGVRKAADSASFRSPHRRLSTDRVRLSAAERDRMREPQSENAALRSEEHTSELQSLMRISYAVFCLKKKTK